MSSTSRIPSALTLGLIAGSNVVVTVVPLGSVIFSGALAAYAVPGTRLVVNAIGRFILAAHQSGTRVAMSGMSKELDFVSDLDPWLEPVEFATGETIVTTGDKPRGALLLASGRASLFDASGNRLAEYGPGDVVGRTDATATTANDVRASEPCRASLLTPAAAILLEKNEERLMLSFYRYVVTHSPS